MLGFRGKNSEKFIVSAWRIKFMRLPDLLHQFLGDGNMGRNRFDFQNTFGVHEHEHIAHLGFRLCGLQEDFKTVVIQLWIELIEGWEFEIGKGEATAHGEQIINKIKRVGAVAQNVFVWRE